MSIYDNRQFVSYRSSAQQIQAYSSKLFYRRFFEVIICLLLYKSCIYWIYKNLFIVQDESIIFYKIIHECLACIFLVYNIANDLFTPIAYSTTYVKYIALKSVRIILLCWNACLVSNHFGITDSGGRQTCIYFSSVPFCYSHVQACIFISNIIVSVLIFLRNAPLSRSGLLFKFSSLTEIEDVFKFNHWIYTQFNKRQDLIHPTVASLIVHFLSGVVVCKIFYKNIPFSETPSCFGYIISTIQLWFMLIVNILVISYSHNMIFYFTTVIFTKSFDFFFSLKVDNVCYKYPLVDALKSNLFIVKCLAYHHVYRIARSNSEKKAAVFKLIHVQDDRPIMWKRMLIEYFYQLNGFSCHVLNLHVNYMRPMFLRKQPHYIIHYSNDIDSYFKFINEYKVLVLVLESITEFTCESIKYHPPSIVNKDIHDVILKLLLFIKSLRQSHVLNTLSCYIQMRRCYHFDRYIENKSFDETNKIYKSVKEVCETQLRKMLTVLHGFLNVDVFTSSVQNELNNFMTSNSF